MRLLPFYVRTKTFFYNVRLHSGNARLQSVFLLQVPLNFVMIFSGFVLFSFFSKTETVIHLQDSLLCNSRG